MLMWCLGGGGAYPSHCRRRSEDRWGDLISTLLEFVISA